MTKQEKIRKGMLKLLCGYGGDVRIENCDCCIAFDEATNRCNKADKFLSFLRSQDVVVKVDNPEVELRVEEVEVFGTRMTVIIPAGYVAVEPLIEESKEPEL